MVRDVTLGLLATVPLVAAVFLVQRVGLFTLLAKLFRALFGGRFDALVGGAAPLDRTVRRLYRRRRALLACFAWQLAGWSAGTRRDLVGAARSSVTRWRSPTPLPSRR